MRSMVKIIRDVALRNILLPQYISGEYVPG